MTLPDPTKVAPWYLSNLTQALELDALTGTVYLRTAAAAGPSLQQDLITNVNHGYINRQYGWTTGKVTGINDTYKDLWEGPTAQYVFPAVGMQMAVVSSSTNDTAAGSGTRTVVIHYLDDSYVQHEEVVTLNGTTPTLTVSTNIFRINAFHVMSLGTAYGSSVGNISLRSVDGTITYGYIMSGHNRARHGFWTIPAGKTGYLSHWQASSGSTSSNHQTQISVRATAHYGVLIPGVLIVQDECSSQDSSISNTLPIPLPFPEKTDIVIRAIADTSNANVTALASLMGWIEDNV